jgi:hypothetical protein
MTPIRVTLEVDSPAQETLLRQCHAFLQEMQQLALTAPAGQVIDVCETAVLQKGQDVVRHVLEQAVRERITALEKKGRRCGPAGAVVDARTAAWLSGKS